VRRLNAQALILIGAIIFVLYLAGVPLVMLLYGSIRSAPIGEPGATYTIQNYVKAYFDKEFYVLFLNSVYYAIGVCSLTFLIGTFLAWVSERTNTPLKKLFVVMALIPFIIPGILSTIAWILLLSPKIGLINLVIKGLLGLESAPFNVYSMWGMIWAESIHLYPLVFLLMSAAFRNMDTSLEEAALTAGSSTLATFGRITLPLMRPAMFSVMLIVFIRGIEAFEVPALIGVPAKISVFTGGALCDGDRQGLPSPGDRSRRLEIPYLRAFDSNLFSRRHHAGFRTALVVLHSLLWRAVVGVGRKDDVGQLQIHH